MRGAVVVLWDWERERRMREMALAWVLMGAKVGSSSPRVGRVVDEVLDGASIFVVVLSKGSMTDSSLCACIEEG